jgi:hypothetical protein
MNENKVDLQAIRKRAEATSAPFWCVKYGIGVSEIMTGTGFSQKFVAEVGNEADAEFIAQARQDVPALIAEVERLRKALEDIVSVDGAFVYRSRDADEVFEIAREALR